MTGPAPDADPVQGRVESPVAAPVTGEITLRGRIMPASNATYLAEVGGAQVVYKPVAGERPLWDFPEGRLAHREVAAYLVSRTLGWDVVPHTWLAEGPHGLGMVQLWCEPAADAEAVTVVPQDAVPAGWRAVFDGLDERDRPVTLVHEDSAALRRMAVFDVIVNNADRKGGHVLAMADGHRYGVDHGIAFHHEHKLRTVLWGWVGEPLTPQEAEGVQRVLDALGADDRGGLGDLLGELLAPYEIEALGRRCAVLLTDGVLPGPRGGHPAVPWPPF